MRILGIDYGRRKIGLALATSKIAEPLKVVVYDSLNEAYAKLAKVIEEEKIEKVVLGISEGEMAKETRLFGRKLEEVTGLKPIYQDETLSTQEAQSLSINAGLKRKKRKELEDAYSATLILQGYLDRYL
jgi:putative Holliday junction resolvase